MTPADPPQLLSELLAASPNLRAAVTRYLAVLPTGNAKQIAACRGRVDREYIIAVRMVN